MVVHNVHNIKQFNNFNFDEVQREVRKIDHPSEIKDNTALYRFYEKLKTDSNKIDVYV